MLLQVEIQNFTLPCIYERHPCINIKALKPVLSACYSPNCVLTAGCRHRADQIDGAVQGHACRVADLH